MINMKDYEAVVEVMLQEAPEHLREELYHFLEKVLFLLEEGCEYELHAHHMTTELATWLQSVGLNMPSAATISLN